MLTSYYFIVVSLQFTVMIFTVFVTKLETSWTGSW